MCEIPENAFLYLDSSRGIYIPQAFFSGTKPECIVWGCDEEQKAWVLESCDSIESEYYWEAWAWVLDNLKVQHPETGLQSTLYQDGDLWLVPEMYRFAMVGGRDLRGVDSYLPSNYTIMGVVWWRGQRKVLIRGIDNAGWNMEQYIIPRFCSGLFCVEEVTHDWLGTNASLIDYARLA